jgi:hypothetical protein
LTTKLTIAFKQKQLYYRFDYTKPYVVSCDVDNIASYPDGIVLRGAWEDMTEWTEGLDKLKLNWHATGGESEGAGNDLGSNYQKGISAELKFTGPAFEFIYEWLMTSPCQVLNAVDVLITDVDCGRAFRVFEIKADNIKYAPFDEQCIVTMVLRERDDNIHVFQKTIIEDDWQQWFNSDGTGVKDHPSFMFVVEKRPKFFLSVLVALGYVIGILSGGVALLFEGFKEWLRKLIGVCYFSPSPLIRTYIENICMKYGFTWNTMFDAGNPYENVCLFFPTQKDHHNFDGFDADTNLFDWDNRTGLAFSLFLDKLKKVFNAEWYITPNNKLVFQPKSYFNNLSPIYDFTQPGAYPLYNFFYEFNGNKKPAYGDYQYKIDPQDACSNDLKWRYNSIVDYDGLIDNPMLEGHVTKDFDYACTSFMYDGATEDFLEAAIKLGRIVASVTVVLFISYLIAAFLAGVLTVGGAIALDVALFGGYALINGWFNDFFGNEKLRGAVRVASNNINIPRLLLWNGDSMTRAKVISVISPEQVPYYNFEGTDYYTQHPAFDADPGYFGSSVVDIYNYPMFIDEKFSLNLYDRFHELDNPNKNPEINQDWEGDVDFCCPLGDLLGIWEGDYIKIGAKLILENRNGRIIMGRITEIEVDYDKGNIHLRGIVLTGNNLIPVENTCLGTISFDSAVLNEDGTVTITGTAPVGSTVVIYGSALEFSNFVQIGTTHTAAELAAGIDLAASTNAYFKLRAYDALCQYGYTGILSAGTICTGEAAHITGVTFADGNTIITATTSTGTLNDIYGAPSPDSEFVLLESGVSDSDLLSGITITGIGYNLWFYIHSYEENGCDYGNSTAMSGFSGEPGEDCCESEDPIFFTDAVSTVVVPWDVATKGNPVFEVYTTDNTPPSIIRIDIQPDAAPPATTQFTFYTNNINGYIIIVK